MVSRKMPFCFNDGGRAKSGRKGTAGDCVARALAIAAQRPYSEIYDRLADGAASERRTSKRSHISGRRSARNGIHTSRQWFKNYMTELGFYWTPTMGIGTGCRVHLASGELPHGRLVVAVSRHLTTVINGVIHDTYDPQREQEPDGSGGRCVYGYWRKLL